MKVRKTDGLSKFLMSLSDHTQVKSQITLCGTLIHCKQQNIFWNFRVLTYVYSVSTTGKKEVETGENRARTSCWPFRIINNDQATRYLIYSYLQSTFDKDGKIARKQTSNHCLPREFWHRKIPWFQKNYIGRSLIVPKQVLIWIPHLVQDSNGKKIMWKKKWIE